MISPQTIALVRERTDVVALIQESVPTLKRRGRSFVGLCPFHKEKSPSFHVNQERGFFHCFGCKESGSAIDFIMKLDGYTFPEAVRVLAERAGVEIEEEKRGDRTEADRQKRAKDDLYSVNNLAAAFFEKMMREHPHRKYALDELARRGLLPSWAQTGTGEGKGGASFGAIDDTLQAFRIGYAPAAWDALASYLKQNGISPVVAEQAGLLVPRSSGSGHFDRFRHRLMFAVIDPQGRVIAFSGRALAPIPGDPITEEKDGKTAKYINSPESPIYTKGYALFGLYQARHSIRTSETAIVVEGNFDVVSLHARGFDNVVAPLGTAFTADQAKLLKRFASTCVLLFDGDAAGRKAIRLSRGPLKDAGIAAKVATPPEGLDPDDLVRTRGSDALKDILERASGLLEFLIDDALDQGFDDADAREKVARVQAVAKLLQEEDDPLLRMMAKEHADRIAGRIDLKTNDWKARRVSEETFRVLEQTVKKALSEEERTRVNVMRPGETKDPPKNARIAPRPPGSTQRAAIVGALVEFPELFRDADVGDCFQLLEGVSVQTVAALRAASEGGTAKLDVDAFFAKVPEKIQSFVSKRLAAPEFETAADAKTDILRNADKLREMLLAQDTREIVHEAARVAGDWEHEVRLAAAASARVRDLKSKASGRVGTPSAGAAPAQAQTPPRTADASPSAPLAAAPSAENSAIPREIEEPADLPLELLDGGGELEGTSHADEGFYGEDDRGAEGDWDPGLPDD